MIDFKLPGLFFPPEKQPLLFLPEILALDEKKKEQILLHTFYKYLHDIIYLEKDSIVYACELVNHGQIPINYSPETKLNAYTIIIDEYYHIYNAYDMLMQLDEAYPHIEKFLYPPSDAELALKAIQEKLMPESRDLFLIVAVCIFETTLIKELVTAFDDPHVHPAVRYYVNDHMNDEARHYGFFFDLLVYTWKNIPKKCQTNIQEHLVEFITLYLNFASDKIYNETLLKYYLPDIEQISHLTSKLYEGFHITIDMPIIKNVIKVLQKAQIMNITDLNNF
jgi:hypothetical protein